MVSEMGNQGGGKKSQVAGFVLVIFGFFNFNRFYRPFIVTYQPSLLREAGHRIESNSNRGRGECRGTLHQKIWNHTRIDPFVRSSPRVRTDLFLLVFAASSQQLSSLRLPPWVDTY